MFSRVARRQTVIRTILHHNRVTTDTLVCVQPYRVSEEKKKLIVVIVLYPLASFEAQTLDNHNKIVVELFELL